MSQTVLKDVKSQGKVITTAEVELFDTLDEAEEALGEKDCVAYINRIRTIEAMDEARRKALGGTSTGARAVMTQFKNVDDDTQRKIKELLGIE